MIASAISASGNSSPKPSIMTTAFSVLETIRSRSLLSSSSAVGNAINLPSTRPSRIEPTGPRKGTRASKSAAEAPIIDGTSASLEPVGRNRARLDLHLVAIPFGKERPDRPVDQPRGEDFLGGRPALTLDEAAREFARRVRLFTVIDGEREEIEPFATGRGHEGDQRHRVADSNDHGTTGLFGEMTRLDAQQLAADGPLDKRA